MTLSEDMALLASLLPMEGPPPPLVSIFIYRLRGAFKLYGILIFFSGMEADRNVKVVGGDVAVL